MENPERRTHSPTQDFLTKVDHRDKLARTLEIIILLIVVAISVFSSVRLNYIINQNQNDSIVRSAQAKQDRQELKDYIKCVLLIRYDNTADQLATRDGVSTALDSCAKKSH